MNIVLKTSAVALVCILAGIVHADLEARPYAPTTVDPASSGVERETEPESGVEDASDSLTSDELQIFSITLNRMLSSLVINFSIRQQSSVHLVVTNASGETVVDFDGGAFPQGNANIFVKVGELRGGDYTCRLTANDLVATEVVSIER